MFKNYHAQVEKHKQRIAQELQKLLKVCSVDVPICKFSRKQETSPFKSSKTKKCPEPEKENEKKGNKKTGSEKKKRVKRNEKEKKRKGV